MRLPTYQADAFASELFRGNPAALVPLQSWLPDTLLQRIAAENNLSETAYTVPAGDDFELRWFTPAAEVPLCGHATLATAHLMWSELDYAGEEIRFHTKSGELRVRREGGNSASDGKDGLIAMDFPAQPLREIPLLAEWSSVFGAPPQRAQMQESANGEVGKLLLEFADAATVAGLQPDFRGVAALPYQGVVCTAAGSGFDCDFVSRFFGPNVGIDEDPVTGSAHTLLTPYWAAKLDKPRMSARQLSVRGGELDCELVGDRVWLRGRAVTYMRGEIEI